MICQMLSRTVDIDGPVHYHDFGGSGPPLVCVHGLGGAAINWMAVGHELARHYRVLAPDLRGFGETPLGRGASTMESNQRLLDRFIREVAGSAAVLVGNSMGGLLSTLQAARHPETVTAAVLADPALPWLLRRRLDVPIWTFFGAILVPGLAEWQLRRRRQRLGPDRIAAQTLAICTVDPLRVPADAREAHLELARRRAERPDGERALAQAARSLLRMLARPRSFASVYQSIRAPVMIVHGERDRLVPVQSSLAIGQRYGWAVEVIPDVGHIPMLEVPERFVGLTLGWLDSSLSAAV
jgi:pimeloyl-ACP methyl ester carboxylesterase